MCLNDLLKDFTGTISVRSLSKATCSIISNFSYSDAIISPSWSSYDRENVYFPWVEEKSVYEEDPKPCILNFVVWVWSYIWWNRHRIVFFLVLLFLYDIYFCSTKYNTCTVLLLCKFLSFLSSQFSVTSIEN